MKHANVAAYIQQILDRHPGLSKRQASLRAGLNENAIQQILNEKARKPRPATLKAITDAWGTPADYFELMRLAGYEVPLAPALQDEREVEALSLFRHLPQETQGYLLQVMRMLSGQTEVLTKDLFQQPGMASIALRAEQLDERGQQAILEMIEYVLKAQEADLK